MQILWVFLTCLPVVYFNSLDSPDSVNTLASIGIGMFSIGLIIEAWADYTKFNHKLNGEKWCASGLWKYSRHPNYLGEIIFWFGIFGFSLSQSLDNWWLIVFPLSMLAMFVFASIPMMDNRSIEKREDYLEYMKETPSLLPFKLLRK